MRRTWDMDWRIKWLDWEEENVGRVMKDCFTCSMEGYGIPLGQLSPVPTRS